MSEQRFLKILIVDDERVSLRHFASVLESLGAIELHRASELREARQVLEQVMIDVAFIDLQLSADIRNTDGLTLIQEIRGRYQTVPIMVSGHSQVHEVREAMKLGARDYVLKTEFEQRAPIILQEFRRELEREQELLDLRARGAPEPTLGLVGTSLAMQNLRALIKKVAAAASSTPAPVLILGPTGSGKEVVARSLHQYGPHPSAPFIDPNCGALVETLVEDQLFGHVRGAFAGADRDQDGYLSLVGEGTLFLDEVAELTPALQAKLLRVLETRRFRPLGPTSKELHFKGRIIAATHVDLKERVREKRFREDLYYRLNVLTLQVPPLSDHREDIPALVQHFAARENKPLHFTQEAIELLCRRPWPGNVRELRSAIYKLLILAGTERIDAATIEQLIPLNAEAGSEDDILRRMAQKLLELPLSDKLRSMSEALVIEAVEQAKGNYAEAARRLGRHRKFVERFFKKINKPRPRK
jgi:DNA-binding NtrC family response regulator